MSIIQRIFGTQPPANAPQPQIGNDLNKNPPPQGTAVSPQTAPNGVVPQGAGDPPKKEEPPLAEFKDLWQPTPADPNAKPAESELTPEKMMEAATKVDFSRIIPQEELAKIAAGGEEATKALVAIVNKVNQASYGQSTIVAKKLVEQAVAQAEEKFASRLPTMMKRQALNDPGNNPALQNPAVAPILQALQSQLVEKYPNRSVTEIEEMAKKVLVGAAEMIVPQQQTPNTGPEKDEVNWEEWIKS